MWKRKFTILLAALMMLFIMGGCKNQKEPELGGLDDVQVVKNFSDFTETEVPTEAPTEPPTEESTEAPTEKITEAQTETQAEETETEVLEEKYSEDFDFSDQTVMSAFYSVKTLNDLSYEDGFSDTIAVEMDKMVQTVSLSDGKVVVTMTADPYSGKTNRILVVTCSQDYLGAVKEGLIALGAGLNEDNIDKFVLGGYNGENEAPYIGLNNASCAIDSDGQVTIVLEKAQQAKGDIPGMPEGGANQTGICLEDSFANIQVTGDTDPFPALLGSVDAETYTAETSTVQPLTRHYDREGNLISEDGLFAGKYISGKKTWSITTIVEEGKTKLVFLYNQSKGLSDEVILSMAEHIYQYFYHGEFDKSVSVDSPYTTNHAILEKNGSGFKLTLG